MADGGLKCFASLADQFIRKGVDPAPLAENGLTSELLARLSQVSASGGGRGHNTKVTGTPGGGGVTSDSGGAKSGQSVSTTISLLSTTISLLSTLCRGSETITANLLRSELPRAIEQAMLGDKRCVLDTMRLTDLLILLFEGAAEVQCRPQPGRGQGFEHAEGEKTHRQLIDCIRSKDTDALVEAVESGQFEVNFMDDVGQTLYVDTLLPMLCQTFQASMVASVKRVFPNPSDSSTGGYTSLAAIPDTQHDSMDDKIY